MYECTSDERAVSPVIGAVVLVAIVVTLAAVMGAIVGGFGDELHQPVPVEVFTTKYVADGADNGGRPYVLITNEGGRRVQSDQLFVVDSSGNEVAWGDVWTAGPTVAPGEYVHIDGSGSDGALDAACEGESYRLVWEGEDGTRHTIGETTVDLPATGPATAYC